MVGPADTILMMYHAIRHDRASRRSIPSAHTPISMRTRSVAVLFWSVTFALLTIGFLSQLGMFILPVAIGLAILGSMKVRSDRQVVLAGLAGPGLLLLAIGLSNLGHVPCPPGAIVAYPGQSVECGGASPTPWIVVGLVVAMLGVVGYRSARNRA